MADVEAVLSSRLVTSVQSRLMDLLRQLCHPDPARRGHPKNLGRANAGSLERYVSILNTLALQAELDLKRQVTE